MSLFFGKTTMLEGEIETFLDDISKSGLVFTLAIDDYLNKNEESFQGYLSEIDKLESDCDNLRREIRYKLYTKMLIPESRGDVLSLLENIDNVVDVTKTVLHQFEIEKPEIPESLHDDFKKLAELSSKALDYTVKSSRAFFKDIHIINDYINKVYFFEHEADKIEIIIKRKVFSSNQIKDFAKKLHIRDFAVSIAKVSDEAEAVCERISVAAIKREL